MFNLVPYFIKDFYVLYLVDLQACNNQIAPFGV